VNSSIGKVLVFVRIQLKAYYDLLGKMLLLADEFEV
jgi:hypothetical protein